MAFQMQYDTVKLGGVILVRAEEELNEALNWGIDSGKTVKDYVKDGVIQFVKVTLDEEEVQALVITCSRNGVWLELQATVDEICYIKFLAAGEPLLETVITPYSGGAMIPEADLLPLLTQYAVSVPELIRRIDALRYYTHFKIPQVEFRSHGR